MSKQKQPSPLERTTIVFLYPPKIMRMTSAGIHGTVREYFYIQYSRNIISEYSAEFNWKLFPNKLGNISWEFSTNIPRTYICPMGTCEFSLTSFKRFITNIGKLRFVFCIYFNTIWESAQNLILTNLMSKISTIFLLISLQ